MPTYPLSELALPEERLSVLPAYYPSLKRALQTILSVRGCRPQENILRHLSRPGKGLLISLVSVATLAGCGDNREDYVITGPVPPVIVTPAPIDQIPQVNLGSGPVVYVRDTTAVSVGPNATFIDDNADLNGGTLTITASGTGLVVNVPANTNIGTVTNNNTSSVSVALDSDATPAAIQAFLRTVTVSSTGGTAALGNRTITVSVTDANNLVGTTTRTVNIVEGSVSNFSSFTLGTVNGQQGFSSPGLTDQGVVAVTRTEDAFDNFGTQALRVSNGTSEPTFNQALQTPPLDTPVGESTAEPTAEPRNNTFEASFTFATTSANEQPNLLLNVGPSDFDEGRMSVIQLQDEPGGIDVVVFEYDADSNTFPPTTIASGLSRTTPHTLRMVLTTVDGPDNDVLRIFVDGALAFTGTGWEEYFSTDPEAIANNLESPRLIDRLLFQVRPGMLNAANLGGGFLFNNVVVTSSNTNP